jgi:hypothetical protein
MGTAADKPLSMRKIWGIELPYPGALLPRVAAAPREQQVGQKTDGKFATDITDKVL